MEARTESFEMHQIKTYLDTLQALSENTDDYLYFWELRENRVWFFGNITERYDLKCDETGCCTVKAWQDIICNKDLPALAAEFQMIERGEITVHNMDYRVRDRQGRYVWINCRGKVQTDETGQPFAFLGRVSDAVLRNKVDIQTGLFNKEKIFEDLRQALDVGKEGFLMILDVDNLKSINITYGREYGNWILKSVANILENKAGDSQKVYRVFGDTFAVCMPEAEQEDVQSVFAEIKKAIEPGCTVSAGAAPFPGRSGKDERKLYQYTEDALDQAKREGKNQLVFFSEENYQKRVAEIELEKELKSSILHGCVGFSLVYQSQVRCDNHQLYGAEALLRYDSPTRGRIMPNDFIRILEQTELLCPVGLWGLETALKQCREWRKIKPDFHISVNMSDVQLKQPDVMEQVLDVLKRSGVPGEALTLEVTESMQLQDFRYYNQIFTKWKQAGITISVDDFGTGYSSLGYLKNLMVDEIKIDRCFVSGIHNNSYNYRLLRNILELAVNSEMQVCCEGVEEKEELQVLENLKPDLLQGYLFSKPCEIETFEKKYFYNEKG